MVGPSHCMSTLLNLIPKKSGGSRGVCTYVTLWRVFMSILCEEMRAWDTVAAAPYDTAVRGCSPDQLVFKRAALASCARCEHLSSIHLLWDITGFYEHVQAQKVHRSVLQEEMPPTSSALSLWGHSANRILTMKGRFGTVPITPHRSLGTGCHSSTSLARGILRRPILSAEAEGVCQSVHVDDFAQETHSSTASKCLVQATGAGAKFVQAVVDAGLHVSSKSVCMASLPPLNVKLWPISRNTSRFVSKPPSRHCMLAFTAPSRG